jgi:hypothetical protein
LSGNKVKLVYIAGMGRSGSTLLARLLGELDGFINVGEAARYLFDTTRMARDLSCGCGDGVSDCVFWKDIVSSIDGDAQGFGTKVLRMRYLPFLIAPIKPPAFQEQLDRFLFALEGLFTSVAERSGCDVIVDSSKHPANAHILSQMPGIELYVVHLVRDPRGIVNSRAKPKEYLSAFSPSRVVSLWLALNFWSESLRFSATKYWLIRYEDFVRNPKGVLGKIAGDIRQRPVDVDFVTAGRATVNLQHMLSGNPDKFTCGQFPIKYQAWHLPWHLQGLVWLLTFPFAYKYRYGIGQHTVEAT